MFRTGSFQVCEALPIVKPVKEMKNVLIISFGFLLVFLPYQSIANLQSTLNSHESNIGLKSQSIIYICVIISSCLLPPLCIEKFTHKWTIVICILFYIPYIGAHFYPTTNTLIPTAVLLGLAAPPLWSSKCDYITHICNNPANLTRYFGIFFAFFQSSNIFGNSIAIILLDDNSSHSYSNQTNASVICGAYFCPEEDNDVNATLETKQSISESRLHVLLIVFIISCFAASILIAIFLDPLHKEVPDAAALVRSISPFQLLLATLNHSRRNRIQWLLIPFTLYSGIEQAFLMSEFNRAYVACTYRSLFQIVAIFLCYGVTDAVLSYLTTYLSTTTCVTSATFCALGSCIFLLFWVPQKSHILVFYGIAFCWAFTDAVWQTQLNALYGKLFVNESSASAFANYRLWESLGFILFFSFDICPIAIKIYFLIISSIIGLICYFILMRLTDKI